jgi:hypothetical protein
MLGARGLSSAHMVWRWCERGARDRRGAHHGRARARASFIPVYWHQHQLLCVKPLLSCARRRETGFLDQPSVDGEIGAMLVRKLGAEVIRGSSSHTGARALARLLSGAGARRSRRRSRRTVRAGRPGSSSPARCCWRSCRSGRSFRWPMRPRAPGRSNGIASSSPSRSARIAIVIGEPVYVAKGLDAAGLERMQAGDGSTPACKALYRKRGETFAH